MHLDKIMGNMKKVDLGHQRPATRKERNLKLHDELSKKRHNAVP